MRKDKKKGKLNFKKVGISLLVMFVVFGATIMYAFADTPFSVEVTVKDPAEAGTADKSPVVMYDESGTYVTYEVNLKNPNSDEFNIVSAKISYNTDKLLLDLDDEEHPAWTPAFLATRYQDLTIIEDDFVYVNVMNKGNNYATGNLKLGTITFKVKEGQAGQSDLKIENVVVQRADNNDVTNKVDYATNEKHEDVFISAPVVESSVGVANPNIQINLGAADKTAQVVMNYEPSFTTDDKTITATVKSGSPLDVVRILDNGKIEGLKTGNTTLEVTAFGKTFDVNVSVVSLVGSVGISPKTTEVNRQSAPNNTIQLTGTINPSDATNVVAGKTTWSSDNAKVHVDNNGLVTYDADARGTATITYTVVANEADGEKSYTDTATITINVPATDASITKSDGTAVADEFNLNMGETLTLKASTTPSDSTDKITWESSRPDVVSVSNSGVLTPVSGGEATITMKVGENITKTVTVKVVIPATSINIDAEDTVKLAVGQTFTLHASVLPTTASNRDNVNWTSSNTGVATISNGVLTAVAPGTTTITASVDGLNDTITIEVVSAVGTVNITEQNVELWTNDDTKDKEKQLTLTTDGDEEGTVRWESSSNKVRVDANGKVTAVESNAGSASEATITATWTSKLDSSKVKTATTTVKVYTNLKDITLSETNVALKIVDGQPESKKITATMSPEINSDAASVSYRSADTSVASVDASGNITAVGKGTTTIVATAGTIEKTVSVTVTIPTTSVVIKHNGQSKDSLRMDINTDETLTADVNPTETTDTLSWSSSDSEIVDVDSTGKITAKKEGKATITATSGEKTDTIEVQVIIPVTSFTLSDGSTTGSLTNYRTRTNKIVTQVEPSNATLQTISWTSSNNEIATVNDAGEVTGHKAGTAVITGTLPDGKVVTVNVTVTTIDITDMSSVEANLNIKKNESSKIELIINPEDTTEVDQIKWTSSDETIATVDEFGNVYGKKEGKVKVKATYKDIEVEVEVEVTEVHIESLVLKAEKSLISVDEKLQLLLDINPTNTTDDLVFTYKSSDENILTVDEFGVVTGKSAGTATVTITHADGKTSSIEITVTDSQLASNTTNPKTPKTEDNSVIYIALGTISLVGGFITVRKLKPKFN